MVGPRIRCRPISPYDPSIVVPADLSREPSFVFEDLRQTLPGSNSQAMDLHGLAQEIDARLLSAIRRRRPPATPLGRLRTVERATPRRSASALHTTDFEFGRRVDAGPRQRRGIGEERLEVFVEPWDIVEIEIWNDKVLPALRPVELRSEERRVGEKRGR